MDNSTDAGRDTAERLVREHRKAIAFYKHAIQLDSNYALAYAERSEARTWIANQSGGINGKPGPSRGAISSVLDFVGKCSETEKLARKAIKVGLPTSL